MINELQNKLHSQIPMTKLMNLKIEDYNDKELITTAPLDININDKGTAFGGSLATMTIISSWSICWLISKELGFDSNNIVDYIDIRTNKKWEDIENIFAFEPIDDNMLPLLRKR